MPLQWNDKVFGIKEESIEPLALEIFRFQAENNPVYRDFLQALKVDPSGIDDITRIPFLPVRFFKSHQIKTTLFEPQAVFESSGTTGSINSKHYVKDLSLYEESFVKGFEEFYGPINKYCIIGLLPSYVERQNSSLVYMVDKLVQLSEHPQSGFYLNEYEQLAAVLQELDKRKQPTFLVGVTFALLDFAEKFSFPLQHTIVMETGGMKGRRKEMIRPEVHDILKKAFQLSSVHSEYGMTELLSQAYSKGEGIFNCPPWMKILMRDEEDPFTVNRSGSGTINIIDLANIYSCSFIATDDVGRLNADGSFEVLGRVDGSDLRGCSLMVV
ncbi:MAG: acyl transferase [Chitinophagaceae bacterium]|nr:acyl transferase [Chitinophagaceae bacterium]